MLEILIVLIIIYTCMYIGIQLVIKYIYNNPDDLNTDFSDPLIIPKLIASLLNDSNKE